MEEHVLSVEMIDITDALMELDEQAAYDGEQKLCCVLDSLVQCIPSLSNEIRDILENTKGVMAVRSALRIQVSSSIIGCSARRLTVIDFVERDKSRQSVHAFVDTHWMPIPCQMMIDFIRKAALKSGLPESFAFDSDFMSRLAADIAYGISQFRNCSIPKNQVWINFPNGTLEIHARSTTEFVMREHRAEDFFLYTLSYPYDPEAQCPLWHKFLDEVLPDKLTQQLLGEAIGYCLTRDLKLEKMFVFHGNGSNGKSVVLDVIEHLLGRANVSNISLSALTTDPEKRRLLENKLVNISYESDQQIDSSVLKQMVSLEPIEARRLYSGTYIMYKYGKLFTSFNQLPPAEHTHGYFRRWILFPFNVTIPDERQDSNLATKLKGEAAGILNWVIEATKRLVENRAFSVSTSCDEALTNYKKTSNSALKFLNERCTIEADGHCKLKDLYSAYCTFCIEEGVKNKFGKSRFKEMLVQWGAEESTYQGFLLYNVKMKTLE